ncbi:MAG: N-acetyltransferase [Candidatus Heimdallarchaeota archaeon]|nr:N-acetyltransferase [Candidatus Heimdallarchaeota archaeon]
MTIEIRKIEETDKDSLIDICYITGDYFLKTIYPDPYLFSLFWCLYYVWYETNNSFVAVDSEKNKIIGYIFSTLNTHYQEKNFKIVMQSKIRDRIKELKLYSIKTWIVTWFLLNRPTTQKRKKILNKYPAHLHINILPEYQRQGIGWKLMRTLELHLKENNIIGYHLEVSANNNVGINFYKKYDLDLLMKTSRNLIFGRKLLYF